MAARKKTAKRTTRAPVKPKPQTDNIDPARRARIEALRQELFGDFLTAAEVGEILDVHPRTVGEYIREGRLHGIQLGGGWRISETALRAFVQSIAELPKDATKGSSGSMFSRFTNRARRVVVLAQEEARLMNHNYIGTEHILLGLISEGEGVGARALESLGVALSTVRESVESIVGSGTSAMKGHIPFTPRGKRVLELSLREALQLGHNYIGTEHIALALMREGEGVAAKVLQELRITEDALRSAVLNLLSGGAVIKSEDIKKADEISKALRRRKSPKKKT